MAIVPAGGAYTNQVITATSQQAVLNALNSILVGVGWTSTFYNKGMTINYVNGQPAAGNTITIAGVTYTARAALVAGGLANEFLIGATSTDTYNNLALAINATPGYIGVLYGNGTVANPTCSAQNWPDSRLWIFTKTPGFAAPIFTVSLTLVNATSGSFTTYTQGAAGYRWDSARDPVTGQQFSVLGLDQGAGDVVSAQLNVRFTLTQPTLTTRGTTPVDGAPSSQGSGLQLIATGGASLRVIANRYGFYIFQDAVAKGSIGNREFICAQMVYTFPGTRPFPIEAINNNGGFVQLQVTNHGYTTGDNVCTALIPNPAVDGFFGSANRSSAVINVDSPNLFTLTTVPFRGPYVLDGYVGKVAGTGSVRQVVQAVLLSGANALNTFGRVQLRCTNSGSTCWTFNGVTNNTITSPSTGVGIPMLLQPCPGNAAQSNTKTQLITGQAIYSEAVVQMGQNAAATGFVVGQLYSHYISLESIAPDFSGLGPDGNQYYILTDTNAGTAGVSIQGTLAVQI